MVLSGAMAMAGAAMWMPSVTVPVPSPWMDSASSISVVAESSTENARTLASGNSSVMGGAGSAGKACAAWEVLEQKPLPMELVRIGNGPNGLEHDQRCGVRLLGRLDHGFVFRRVFVGLEQDFVQLVPNGLRALACCQLSHPGVDLRQHGLFFRQRLVCPPHLFLRSNAAA